jgi:hypothetical protein
MLDFFQADCYGIFFSDNATFFMLQSGMYLTIFLHWALLPKIQPGDSLKDCGGSENFLRGLLVSMAS